MNIINRKAKFNFELLDKHEAGIELTGADVKAIRSGAVNLTNSFAKIIDNQIWLVNAVIGADSRSRRLLLHKREIGQIEAKIKQKKLTLVPVRLYNTGSLIKAEIALAKSKRTFEKKEVRKARDIKRDIDRELK
jgi:SsrA-binding protein